MNFLKFSHSERTENEVSLPISSCSDDSTTNLRGLEDNMEQQTKPVKKKKKK